MGPSRELGGQHVSRALGMRTWCTCPDVARDGPEAGGQMGLGLQEARVHSAKRFCTCSCTEGQNGFVQDPLGRGGQLQCFPWFLCVLRAFSGRWCLHPGQILKTRSVSGGTENRPGWEGRRRRSPDLSAAGWDTRDWSGRAARRPRGVTWSVRTHRTKKAEAGARRDGTALRSPLPRPSPPLTGGASILDSRHPQVWPFGGGVFKKRNGTALVFLVSQLAFSNIEHRPLLIYTDYHTFRVLKMILGFKN